MAGSVSFLKTVAWTVLAGLIAWGAWEYSRPLVAAILPPPLAGFLAEFRFAVSILAVIVALSLAQAIIGRIEAWLGKSGE